MSNESSLKAIFSEIRPDRFLLIHGKIGCLKFRNFAKTKLSGLFIPNTVIKNELKEN